MTAWTNQPNQGDHLGQNRDPPDDSQHSQQSPSPLPLRQLIEEPLMAQLFRSRERILPVMRYLWRPVGGYPLTSLAAKPTPPKTAQRGAR